LRRAADENPQLLFVLKKHPIERRDDYRALEELKNVMYLWEDIDIGDLIERAAIFFHYGSTSLADAYLARIPAVYVHSREKRCHDWFPDMGWPSARSVASDQIPEAVRDFLAGRIVQDENDPRIKTVLKYNFNIHDGEEYRPSRRIAAYLLADHQPPTTSWGDRHMWRALCHYYHIRLRRRVGQPIKKALRAVRAHLQQ
jgi:hypothetical protein